MKNSNTLASVIKKSMQNMIIIAALAPIRKGLKVTLTDTTKMPELVEKYDVVNTNGLILDIEERKEK